MCLAGSFCGGMEKLRQENSWGVSGSNLNLVAQSLVQGSALTCLALVTALVGPWI